MKENNQATTKKQGKLFQALRSKKPILQRLAECKPKFSQIIKSIPAILFLPLCIAFCYVLSILFIGDGAYGYSDQLYTKIEQAISDYVITKDKFQIGISEDSNQADATNEIASEETSDTISDEDIHPGIDSLGIYEQYKQEGLDGRVYVNLEPNNSQIVSSIKNGFFEAVVTRDLADDLSTMGDPERNFNSLGEYMRYFWLVFGLSFILGGLGLWFLIELAIFGVLRFIFWIVTKKASSQQQTSASSQAVAPQEHPEHGIAQA